MEKVDIITIENGNPAAGTITWDQEKGTWDYETDNPGIERTLKELSGVDDIPFRGGFDDDGTIFEVDMDVDAFHPLFLRALSDYLIEHSDWVLTLRPVGAGDRIEKLNAVQESTRNFGLSGHNAAEF